MSITFTSCWAGVIMCQRSSAGLPGCTSEFEYAFGIGSQEELAGLLVEIVLVESVQALQRRPGRMLGAEQHLVAAVTAEDGDDLGRIARGDVGAGRLTRSPRTGRDASRSAPRPRRLRSTGQRGPTKRTASRSGRRLRPSPAASTPPACRPSTACLETSAAATRRSGSRGTLATD